VRVGSDPSVHLCVENAENSLRNAASLDATNAEAERLLRYILGGEGTVHERKPKEFVAELFDSFADTFDEKLLDGLSYKVPRLVGDLVEELSKTYSAVLDAGCGTGLAGRYLRPLLEQKGGILVGVDASQKMIDIAAKCTTLHGCGLKRPPNHETNPVPIYDALIKLDLEEITISNTLPKLGTTNSFDLVVAADVLVYFGSLQAVLATFASVSGTGARLVFSAELASEEEAPLGWRLLSTGRFSHTKSHALEAAMNVGYELVHYQEIVPRMEKGEPVQGHLFAFQLKGKNDAVEEEL